MRLVVVCVALGFISAGPQVGRLGPPGFAGLLDRYDRGDYDAVVADLEHLAPTDAVLDRFETEATGWIHSGTADQVGHRAMVAAALALEIAHPREEPNRIVWVLRARAILWGASLVPSPEFGASAPVWRRWYLASIAGLEMLEMRPILTGEIHGPFRDPQLRQIATLAAQQGAGGYLARALKAYPEPRIRLAQIEMQEYPPMMDGGTDLGEPLWTFQYDAACPETVAALHARLAATPPGIRVAQSWRAEQDQIKALLAVIATLPQLVHDYTSLANDESVRAEATLRLGYLQVRLCDWPAALDAFRQMRTLTADPVLIYLSHFLAARALDVSGQRDAAIAAYETALTVRPHAWSASLLLATQLLLSDRPDDRARAYAVGGDVGAGPAPDDPWRTYRLGDARLWPEYMTALREALHR